MSTYIAIVKGLVDLGYLKAGIDRKSKVRKNPQKVIKEFMKSTGYNLLINNVPTVSVPRESLMTENINESHVFETLAEFGTPQYVMQVTYDTYFAYATDAESIQKELDGMRIDMNKLLVDYTPLALPLDVKTDVETQDKGFNMSFVFFQFCVMFLTGVIYNYLF